MKTIDIDDLLTVQISGLNDTDDVAWQEYLRSQYGAYEADRNKSTKGVRIQGKEDKAKTKIRGGDIEFKGHNLALAVLHLCTDVVTMCQNTGYILPKGIDVSNWAAAWKERRDKERAKKQAASVPAPAPATKS